MAASDDGPEHLEEPRVGYGIRAEESSRQKLGLPPHVRRAWPTSAAGRAGRLEVDPGAAVLAAGFVEQECGGGEVLDGQAEGLEEGDLVIRFPPVDGSFEELAELAADDGALVDR